MTVTKNRYLAGTVSERVRDAAHDAFHGVANVDLSLELEAQAFSYEDTWALEVTCDTAELEGIEQFINAIGPGPGPVMVDMCAVDGKLLLNFYCWRSECGDAWGDCPELNAGARPYPGMEFERPENEQ